METSQIPTEYLQLLLTTIIVTLPLTIIILISRWKIFTKAGKKGWANLIPIYSDIVLLQIVKLPLWHILLIMIPIANIYYLFKIHIELAHKFGKSTGFGIATVFFGFICFPILAFSKKSVYCDNKNNQNSFYQQNPKAVSQTPLPTSTTPLFTPPKIETTISAVEKLETKPEQPMVNNSVQQPIVNTIAQDVQDNQTNRVETLQENTFKYVFPPKDENQPEPEKPFDNFPKTNQENQNIPLPQQSRDNNLFPQPKVTNLNNGNNINNIN